MVSAEKLQETVTALCALGEKVAGSEEEKKACDFITGKLAEYGIQHTVNTFQSYVSYPRSAKLTINAPESYEVLAVGCAFALSTPEGGFTAQVVHCGDGNREEYAGKDVKGKIAMINKLPTPDRAVAAIENGAKGIICMSAGKQRHKMIITPVWGTPGFDQAKNIPRIHAVSISAEDGKKLVSLAEKGELIATLETDCFEGWRELRLPVAEIKGSEPEFVLLGAHYCSWFDGSTDNVTGDSCILELARLMKQFEGKLRYGVRIAWWPGHSHGRYSGSTWYADTYFQDLRDNGIVYFNVDSPGVRGATIYVPRHQMGEVSDFNETTTREVTGWDTDTSSKVQLRHGSRKNKYVSASRPARAGDQSFWGVGLSSLSVYAMLTSDHPDRDLNVGGSGGAWWWHSEHETLEKADMGVLSQDASLYVSILLRLTTADVLPMNFTHAAQDFLDALREHDENVGDALPVKKVMDLAQNFQNSAAAMYQAAQSLDDEEATKTLNKTYLRVAREINPVLYQRSHDFEHDPALASCCLPDLAPALELPSMDPESDQYKFTVVGLKRKLNRVANHLVEATRLIDDWRARQN